MQGRGMWKGIGGAYGWKHLRAPSVRAMFGDEGGPELPAGYKSRVYGDDSTLEGGGEGGSGSGRGGGWARSALVDGFLQQSGTNLEGI